MENEIFQRTKQHITSSYEEITEILFDLNSYSKNQDIRLNNISKYLSFVNSSLDKPYGRIVHIHAFISSDRIMSDRMYPFCYLSKSAKNKIKAIYCQSDWIIDGLRQIAPNYAEILENEPHDGKE